MLKILVYRDASIMPISNRNRADKLTLLGNEEFVDRFVLDRGVSLIILGTKFGSPEEYSI